MEPDSAADLSPLSVLVTRPEGRGDALIEAIRAAGGHACSLPLLQIGALDPERDVAVCRRSLQKIAALDRYHRIIFISVNAVHYGLDMIRSRWSQLPVAPDYFAIGAATAQALRERGVALTSVAAGMNSESLLASREFADVAGEKILIVRGIGGRELLAEHLRQRGATVEYAECYRREPPPTTTGELARLLSRERINCICVNSGETLGHLQQLLDGANAGLAAKVHALALIVPSRRVARQARLKGFKHIIVAANAGTEATLQALQALGNSGRT